MLVAIVVGVPLLGGCGGSSYQVTGEFENASQLVPGNEVVVGGVAVGSVKSIELGEDGQALVDFTVEDEYAPLKRGTVATVRSYSLSGVANRQVQLTIPPDSEAGEADPTERQPLPIRDRLRGRPRRDLQHPGQGDRRRRQERDQGLRDLL